MARASVRIIGDDIDTGSAPFIKKSEVVAPFTTIQDRAKVDSSLQTIMGVERIHVNSLNLLPKEFGLNGEAVFETDNSDARIRFVGRWESYFDTDGSYAHVNAGEGQNDPNNLVEITFYGTGLNFLGRSQAATHNLDIFVDGSSSGSLNMSSMATFLNNRNVKQFMKKNVVKGLALGWHTVRLSMDATNTNTLRCYGFEILNEASQITVKSGTAYVDGNEINVSDTTIDYNLGFENVADLDIGTRGGRVLVYVDSDGVKKKLMKTEATAQYMTSTDHSNEAPYRRMHPREFGRTFTNDFGGLDASLIDAAFTVDDCSTTLVGDNVRANDINIGDLVVHAAVGGDIVLTFTGTGLDIITKVNNPSAAARSWDDITVDGVSVGSISTPASGPAIKRVDKICSGLPYGTHTVRFQNSGGSNSPGIDSFILYQPKKPELPSGAIEISDYNILADYIANTNNDIDATTTGIISKVATRELVAIGGSFSIGSVSVNKRFGYYPTFNSTNYIEHTFFGTGVVFNASVPDFGGTVNFDISIDGVLNDTGTDLVNVTNSGSGNYSNSSTTSNDVMKVAIKNLPLGEHTIRINRQASGSNQLQLAGFDIITPIHKPHTTFAGRSLGDLRNFDSNKDANKNKELKIEASINFNGNNVVQFVRRSKNVSQVMRTGVGTYVIWYEEPLLHDTIPIFGGTTGNQEYITSYLWYSNSAEDGDEGYGDGWAIGVASYNAASGGAVDRAIYSIAVQGRLEKDELEE